MIFNLGKKITILTFTLIIFMNSFQNVTMIYGAALTDASKPLSTSNQLSPDIIAPSAVLIDAKSGVIIFDKAKDQKSYPASITKIMTALLTLEYAKNDLNQRIKFSHNSVFSLPYGSSHIAMDEGETLTIEQAMYGLMLASANEVANALAEHISGSIDNFAKQMTDRAKELGANNTNFTNPHGLHDEDHYTTAYDMALIMRQALSSDEFKKIISTYHYDIPPTEKQPEQRPLNNSHKMIQSFSNYYDEYVIGGKTGFTSEALHTLVTYAQKGDIELIVVVMQDEKAGAYTDTRALLDYGFTQFEEVEIFNKSSYVNYLPVIQKDFDINDHTGADGTENPKSIDVVAEQSVSLFLPKTAVGNIATEVHLPDKLYAPITKGDVVGTLILRNGQAEFAKVNLLANTDVEKIEAEKPLLETDNAFPLASLFYLKIFLMTVSGIFVLFVVLQLMHIRNRNIRRSAKYRLMQDKQRSYRYKNNF